jgi:flagellar biosynthetic protein FliR
MGLLEEMAAGFLLVLARTGALIGTAPLFGQGVGFVAHRVVLTVALSFLLYVVAGGPVAAEPVELALMMLREVLIGVFLGTLLVVVLAAVRIAGELIGQEMGFLTGRQVDPVSGVATTLIPSLYESLFVLLLLVWNAHHWLLGALERSFALAPVGRLALGARLSETVVALFGEMTRAGIVFAAPVLVFLLIVSLVIGFLARAVPSLNVLEVGFTLRVFVALIALVVLAPLFEPGMRTLQRELNHWLERGLQAL